MSEALLSPHWLAAMQQELASLDNHGTWELTTPPPGTSAIPVRWVFKLKRTADGTPERCKARLVAKGFMQRPGEHFTESFAPTTSHATLRTFLAHSACQRMHVHQLDVCTAFLNGELQETVFIDQPPGFETGGAGIKCRLRKALYGLRQASRAWYEKLKKELLGLGFVQSKGDPSLFIQHREDGQVVNLLVYVDDLLVASTSLAAVEDVKRKLASCFELRDLGDVDFFLGWEVDYKREQGVVKISQQRYALDVVEKFGLQNATAAPTPMSNSAVLLPAGEESNALPCAQKYQEIVGSLMYLSSCSRPDIAYAVGKLARFMSAPTQEHYRAALRVVRYVAGTVSHGVVYGGQEKGFEGYGDSDWAGDVVSRRSTTGFVFLLNGGAVSWRSKLQSSVAKSSVEAEYMAASDAVAEALWMRTLLADFGLTDVKVQMWGDNEGALSMMRNQRVSNRTKHIDVRYHFVRERVESGEIVYGQVPSAANRADGLTKAVDEAKFVGFRTSLGMRG